MPRVSVIIVNYNSGEHLRRALDSIAAHVPDALTIVVDNASQDGSERTADGRVNVTLVRHPTNVGFSAGVNLGAAAAPAGVPLLLLNPDGVLTRGAVDALLGELGQRRECAVAAPTIRNDDGTVQGSVRGDPTIMTGLFGRTTWLTRQFPHLPIAQRHVVTSGRGSRESRSVDWVSGACMLIRRDAFDAVGGFDEDYFLFWEDADLCRRLRQRGYTVRYVPAAEVIHLVGGSSGGDARARTIREFHRSAFHYYRTHVARNPLTRGLAWLLLAARCRWKLLARRA